MDLDEFETFAVTVAELEAKTGVRFDTSIHTADATPIPTLETLGRREPIRELSMITW